MSDPNTRPILHCLQCGTPNPSGAQVCSACGRSFGNMEQSTEPIQRQAAQRSLPPLRLVVSVEGVSLSLRMKPGERRSLGRICPFTGVAPDIDLADMKALDLGVSRMHAELTYTPQGVFLMDLGSANGTFVNDVQINQAWPLVNGDVIRLYVPELRFSAVVTEQERNAARTTGRLSTRSSNTGQGQLIITNGPMEGNTIRLLAKLITVGRATANADWDISLADPSVSRPHARLEYVNQNWVIYDLGSSNGTLVNDVAVTEKGRVLRDGDVLLLGKTKALFRSA